MAAPPPGPGFRWAALRLAERLEAMPVEKFMPTAYPVSGLSAQPRYDYDRIAIEFVEFLTPYAPGDSPEYETVARRGWRNADRIATADWAECLNMAAMLIRGQRTAGGPILGDAHRLGMLSALLRRMADLVEVKA